MRIELPDDRPNFTILLTAPCTWPADRPGGPASGQLRPLAPPSGPREAVVAEDACRSPKIYVYSDEARPFSGRGPHLMALAHYSDEKSVEHGEFFLPDGWEPKDTDSYDQDRKRVQLLVCVRMDAKRDTGRNVTCHYSSSPLLVGSPHTFDLFESLYHVVVREALTGKKITEFPISGTQGGKDSCPYESGLARKLARGIDVAALHRKLRPLLKLPR